MATAKGDAMYTYKETVTIDDPQRLVLKQPLPLRKGQRVEVLVVAEGEDAELEMLRSEIAKRGVTESDVKDAIAWARGRA
jgi:predicted DNA-binding antitoxin AbrB/MazE fold protein